MIMTLISTSLMSTHIQTGGVMQAQQCVTISSTAYLFSVRIVSQSVLFEKHLTLELTALFFQACAIVSPVVVGCIYIYTNYH